MSFADTFRPVAQTLSFVPFLLAAATQSGLAQTNRAALVARLDSLAGAPVLERRAAGISVAVVRGGDTLLLKSYGKANIELDVPLPVGAVHEIGSVTKQFTAAAVLQLRDEGKLSLDDDLTKFLPNYPTGGRKIPIRRLLDHTSGIKGLTEIPAFRELQHRGWPRDSAIALMARQPFEFPTGEAQIYNNSAFVLLGHVIEKASGMTYEQYVENKIFAPLGMKKSSYCNNSEIVPGRASGYQIADANNMRRAPLNDHTWPFSAGSLCSTAGDMVGWLQALHGGKVLTPASYKDMTTPSRLNDGTALRYGMALTVGQDARGALTIGHGGAIAGFNSYAGWYPDAKLAIVVLINSNGPVSPEAIASELAGEIIPRLPLALKTYNADATDLVGRYRGPSRGREMMVEVSRNADGVLVASVNGAAAQALPWIEAWKFGRRGQTFMTFERAGTTGPATLLRYDGGGGYYMLKRVQQ